MRRLALALLLAAPAAALAHGDAAWIAAGGYKDAAGYSCCGVSDCEPVEESAVTRTSEGWVFEGILFADVTHGAGLHASEDGRFWRCKWGGRTRCLFVNPEGT